MRWIHLDRITELDPPHLARGIRCVSLSDEVFEDHFPGMPVFPGVLQIEGLAQLAGVLVECAWEARGQPDRLPMLTMVDRTRFRRVVRPGDQLVYEVRDARIHDEGARVQGTAHVDGTLTAEATLTFVATEVHEPRLLQARQDLRNLWLHGTVAP